MKVIRFLVAAKPHVLRLVRRVLNPFVSTGRFLIGTLGVPTYRAAYFLRRHLLKVYRPAKNKIMIFVTNRYSVHVVLTGLVAFTVFLNVTTDEVRAESFGESSLMYSLLSRSDLEIIEEYAGDEASLVYAPVSYRDNSALSSLARGVDFIAGDESALTTLVGGSSLTSPTISQGADSIAPRTQIEVYAVQSGDTLSTIAEQFGISLNTLLWANDLTVRSVIGPGDELTILPTSGVVHTVASGDTLTKIASKYDAEADDILAFNKLASANDLVVGESIIVPGGARQAVTTSRSTAFSSVLSSPTTSVPTTTSSLAPTTSGSGSMVWPTDLFVITQYYGWRHTGIDIDCHFTHDNYAADDGIVQFSGWKGGYGYTVEINHGNGIVTRYGHHSSMYVSAGQQVAKGQPIGRCGTTGYSTGTHLHFETIVNGRFRNPLEYIR